MASLAFVLLGCSDKSTPLDSISDPAISIGLPNAAGPSLAKGFAHVVTGSSQMFVWEGPDNFAMPLRYLFNFNAKKSIDGIVSGGVSSNEPNGETKTKATVVGLKVDGNKAKLEFHFTSGPPRFTDRYGFLVVIDNGEGAGKKDMITIMAIYEDEPYPTLADWFAMSPNDLLAFLQAAQPYIPVNVVQECDAGNIQVR
jgi:hypothetical protein